MEEEFEIVDTQPKDTLQYDMAGRRRPLVAGVGVNDANYTVRPVINGVRAPCPAWRAWNAMICRCYDGGYTRRNPSYIGCHVSEDWWIFSAFKVWWDSEPEHRKQKGWALDKDLLSPDGRGKLYSSTTCVLIPRVINMVFHTPEKSSSGLPRGVRKDKNTEKYKANLRVNSRLKHIGSFSSIEEAHFEYLRAKSAYIISLAEEYRDEVSVVVYEKLYEVAEGCVYGKNH